MTRRTSTRLRLARLPAQTKKALRSALRRFLKFHEFLGSVRQM